MICPECQKQGLKSKVYPGVSTVTLMGISEYYDEEGRYHRDDPNIRTSSFSCSKGHRWSERYQHGKLLTD